MSNNFTKVTKEILNDLKTNDNFEYSEVNEYPTINSKNGFDYNILFKKSEMFFKSINRIDRDILENYIMELAYYMDQNQNQF